MPYLFVSRFFPYTHVIQAGVSRYELIPESGRHQEVVIKQHLEAEFYRGVLSFAARQHALQEFDAAAGTTTPLGPYRTSNLASDPDFEGFIYDGTDIQNGFSQFDTARDCPTGVVGMTDDEVRLLFEKTLLASGDRRAGDLIVVDEPRVSVPWPTYDTIVTGQGVQTALVAKRIVETVEQTGLDPVVVLAYERENLNRDYVTQALTELVTRREQAIAEIGSLSV